MKTVIFNLLGAGVLIWAAGCRSDAEFERRFGASAPAAQVQLTPTAKAPKLDGKLDDLCWQNCPVYPIGPAFMEKPWESAVYYPKRQHTDAIQRGQVRFLYDENFLYIGARLTDTDVVQRAQREQSGLYATGDTLEIFVKSNLSPKYIEFYAAPDGKRTTIFPETRTYPRRDSGKPLATYRVKTQIQGTLNDYTDRDQGWTVEAAIPLRALEQHTGIKFNAQGQWTLLIGRYNYTFGDKYARTLHSFPQLPYPDFSVWEYFAQVQFAPRCPRDKKLNCRQ